jgi:hypothetical protein
MRFTSALALSAIAFLGAAAAPGSPPSHTQAGGYSAPPVQSSGATSGTTNSPSPNGGNQPNGGSSENEAPPVPSSTPAVCFLFLLRPKSLA